MKNNAVIDRYCVMGNPVQHSKSPWIHARFALLTAQPLAYEQRLVPLHGFAASLHEFMASSGAKGCNVTVPFKFEAFALAQHVSARAALAGAANTLSFRPDGIHADNTDGAGLVRDIEVNAGVKLAGRRLLLLGAGGAAAGVLGPLLRSGVAQITVANRTLAKAQQLVHQHAALVTRDTLVASTLAEVQGRYDVVINATSTSLSGESLALPSELLQHGALAYDMMYGPAAQGFLAWARALGAEPRDGAGMLVEQAAEAFFIWRGVRPPSAQVLAELRAL